MNADEFPEGKDRQPTDITLPRHARCEVCDKWHEERALSLYLSKVRCPRCRHAASGASGAGQGGLF